MNVTVALRRVAALWTAPLWLHAGALGLILVIALLLVGKESVFSSDEGAGLAQMESVADGRWGVEHPVPEIDPRGRWFPLEKSAPATEGGYAPLPKKVAYTWLGAQLWPLGGPSALVALSAAATVVSAVAAAKVTAEVEPRLDRAALWVTGLASPLLADGLLVIAHAVGAAAAATAALAALRWWRRGGVGWLLVLILMTCAGILLRAESLLLAAAMAAGWAVLAIWRRDARSVTLAAVIAVSALTARWVDLRLSSWAFVGAEVSVPASRGSSSSSSQVIGYLDDRVYAFVTTWFRPGYGDVGIPQLLAVLVPVLGVALVVLIRRGEPPPAVTALSLGIAAIALWRAFGRAPIPDVVPGLLVAFPLLSWGVAGLSRRALRIPAATWCLSSFTLFSMAVLATQYREGGAWEWGGRYFAVGLPLVTPIVVLGGANTLHRVREETRRVLTAVILIVVLSSAALQVLAVRDSHVLGQGLVDHVLQVASETPSGDGGLPVILSTEPELPRAAWRELDQARWLHVPIPDLDLATRRLRSAGIDDVVIATLRGPEVAVAMPRLANARRGQVPEAGLWWFEPLEIG